MIEVGVGFAGVVADVDAVEVTEQLRADRPSDGWGVLAQDFEDLLGAGSRLLDGVVGEPLLEEVNLNLSRIDQGRSTVSESEAGYDEYWRRWAEEFGLQSADTAEGTSGEDIGRTSEQGSAA
ncbi:hypothetical protein [Natrinema marinum]|uniref:hypothetical protein n=1 Tax=Natrinema marinum TaxID=2961598 RepID=UPI003CE5024B